MKTAKVLLIWTTIFLVDGLTGTPAVYMQESRERSTDVWIEIRQGVHNRSPGYGVPGPYLLRKKGRNPLFVFHEMRLDEAENIIPFVIVVNDNDGFGVLASVDVRTTPQGFSTIGKFRGENQTDVQVKYECQVNWNSMQVEAESIAVITKPGQDHTNDSFSLSEGRVIELRWSSQANDVKVTQHEFEVPSKDLTRAVTGLMHDNYEKYEAVFDWWLDGIHGE